MSEITIIKNNNNLITLLITTLSHLSWLYQKGENLNIFDINFQKMPIYNKFYYCIQFIIVLSPKICIISVLNLY
jgi:hypothetical protein